eukprot:scaffold514936_cov33-Prasinocladus_malaysianus.AAC.2
MLQTELTPPHQSLASQWEPTSGPGNREPYQGGSRDSTQAALENMGASTSTMSAMPNVSGFIGGIADSSAHVGVTAHPDPKNNTTQKDTWRWSSHPTISTAIQKFNMLKEPPDDKRRSEMHVWTTRLQVAYTYASEVPEIRLSDTIEEFQQSFDEWLRGEHKRKKRKADISISAIMSNTNTKENVLTQFLLDAASSAGAGRKEELGKNLRERFKLSRKKRK